MCGYCKLFPLPNLTYELRWKQYPTLLKTKHKESELIDPVNQVVLGRRRRKKRRRREKKLRKAKRRLLILKRRLSKRVSKSRRRKKTNERDKERERERDAFNKMLRSLLSQREASFIKLCYFLFYTSRNERSFIPSSLMPSVSLHSNNGVVAL